MVIGLYDIDFNHGKTFSLSLPLMKAYTYFYNLGHQVIMMNPYEKVGRYTKIYYFKDNPTLALPQKLKISKKGKTLGYGFYGEAGLTNPDVIAAVPSFQPYNFKDDKIKNRTLYNSIRNNSLIDWREKDFTGYRTGTTITYINDRNFLQEADWEELFKSFDNNISFVHPIICNSNNSIFNILDKNFMNTLVVIPIKFDEDYILKTLEYRQVVFDNRNISNEELFLFILFCKIITKERITFYNPFAAAPFTQNLIQWAAAAQVSFKDFLNTNWKEFDYYNFKYRILLKQNPQKISLNSFKNEYLTF